MKKHIAKLWIWFARLIGSAAGIVFFVLMFFSIPLSVIAIIRLTGWEWWGALIGLVLLQVIPLIGQLAYVVFSILGAYYFVSTDFDWRRAISPSPISISELTVQKSDDRPLEYVDNQYQFAFHFPRDWKLDTKPLVGEAGEQRVSAKHPTKPIYVLAVVTGPGLSILTKDKYDTAPNRDAVTAAMLQFTIDETYNKISREIGAKQMIVTDKKVMESNIAIQLYISTLHMVGPKDNMLMLVAGIHKIPFKKPYMISFFMFSPVDKAAAKDNETVTNIFNSFHLIGETPIQ